MYKVEDVDELALEELGDAEDEWYFEEDEWEDC